MTISFPYGKGHPAYDFEETELKQVLTRARVIYVSEMPDEMIRAMHMLPANSIGEALTLAKRLLGRETVSVTAIPDGIGVVVNAK